MKNRSLRSGTGLPALGVYVAISLLLGGAKLPAATISSVNDPTTNFRVVSFPNQNDYFNDQQTGQGSSDIVGNTANPGFFTAFDGTNVYYRVRLGATDLSKSQPAYAGLFWVGMDANGDGKIDLFLGVNNQGSNHFLQFQSPGTGANNSPSTTSIGSAVAAYQIAESTSNYKYASVSTALQPGLIDTDLNADNKIDSFLTFRVPFAGAAGTATLQGALAGIPGININASTSLSYVIATSTQQNSLNQDIGGLPKAFDGTKTWTQLGGITPPLHVDGSLVNIPTPEPGTWVQLCSGGLVIALCAIRKRRAARRD
jgi:hypothetical protein